MKQILFWSEAGVRIAAVMKKRVLLVDDDPLVIKIVKKVIDQSGHDVDFSEDGLDALVKIKQDPPDLVVLDIMMPEINGYDVCYQLRYNDDYDKIPIILLTVRDRELPDNISKESDIAYIRKPIDIKQLSDAVDQFLT